MGLRGLPRVTFTFKFVEYDAKAETCREKNRFDANCDDTVWQLATTVIVRYVKCTVLANKCKNACICAAGGCKNIECSLNA
jgi:hypothetical protein